MKFFIAVLLLFTFSSAFSQSEINYKGESINRLDANNKKTGVWKIYDEDRKLVITSEFNDGVAIGFTKAHENGNLVWQNNHDEKLITIYRDGKPILARFDWIDNDRRTLVDENGNELDTEIVKYFFKNASILPQYYGGMAEVGKFVKANIDYKKIGKDRGKVIVKFTLDNNGVVSTAEINESSNENLNQEAIRLVKAMPRWQPGYQTAYVRVQYMLPINFN